MYRHQCMEVVFQKKRKKKKECMEVDSAQNCNSSLRKTKSAVKQYKTTNHHRSRRSQCKSDFHCTHFRILKSKSKTNDSNKWCLSVSTWNRIRGYLNKLSLALSTYMNQDRRGAQIWKVEILPNGFTISFATTNHALFTILFIVI